MSLSNSPIGPVQPLPPQIVQKSLPLPESRTMPPETIVQTQNTKGPEIYACAKMVVCCGNQCLCANLCQQCSSSYVEVWPRGWTRPLATLCLCTDRTFRLEWRFIAQTKLYHQKPFTCVNTERQSGLLPFASKEHDKLWLRQDLQTLCGRSSRRLMAEYWAQTLSQSGSQWRCEHTYDPCPSGGANMGDPTAKLPNHQKLVSLSVGV